VGGEEDRKGMKEGKVYIEEIEKTSLAVRDGKPINTFIENNPLRPSKGTPHRESTTTPEGRRGKCF